LVVASERYTRARPPRTAAARVMVTASWVLTVAGAAGVHRQAAAQHRSKSTNPWRATPLV
jgi:hypothetical protein